MLPQIDIKEIEEIRLKRKRKPVTFMYVFYGDESHDEFKKRAFVVAGLLGTQEDWDELEAKWKERTGGKIFHAAECESDQGEFKDISHQENLELYKDLTILLSQTKLMGYGAAMNVAVHDFLFPEGIENRPYYAMFMQVVKYFAKLGSLLIPPGEVKFTFDNNFDTMPNSKEMYKLMSCSESFKYRRYLSDEISFASRKTVGIQVADLWAREVMKKADVWFKNSDRPTRRSLKTLLDTKRYKVDFFDKEYFEEEKKRLPEFQHVIGVNHAEYAEWVHKNKLIDCATTRTRYLIYLEETIRPKFKGNSHE